MHGTGIVVRVPCNYMHVLVRTMHAWVSMHATIPRLHVLSHMSSLLHYPLYLGSLCELRVISLVLSCTLHMYPPMSPPCISRCWTPTHSITIFVYIPMRVPLWIALGLVVLSPLGLVSNIFWNLTLDVFLSCSSAELLFNLTVALVHCFGARHPNSLELVCELSFCGSYFWGPRFALIRVDSSLTRIRKLI